MDPRIAPVGRLDLAPAAVKVRPVRLRPALWILRRPALRQDAPEGVIVTLSKPSLPA